MRVVNRKVLFDANRDFPDAQEQIEAWLSEAEEAEWRNPHEVKEKYGNASFPGDRVAIFNIKGNDYRLETRIHYQQQVVMIEWFGTHKEYDKRNEQRK